MRIEVNGLYRSRTAVNNLFTNSRSPIFTVPPLSRLGLQRMPNKAVDHEDRDEGIDEVTNEGKAKDLTCAEVGFIFECLYCRTNSHTDNTSFVRTGSQN
jgi:hypothetical protein